MRLRKKKYKRIKLRNHRWYDIFRLPVDLIEILFFDEARPNDKQRERVYNMQLDDIFHRGLWWFPEQRVKWLQWEGSRKHILTWKQLKAARKKGYITNKEIDESLGLKDRNRYR